MKAILIAVLGVAAITPSLTLAGSEIKLPNLNATWEKDVADRINFPDMEKENRFGLGLSGSLLGGTLEASYHLTETIAIRGMYGTGKLDYTSELDGNQADLEGNFSGYGILFDAYPTGGALRLSAGAIRLNHKLTGSLTGNIGGYGSSEIMDIEASFKNNISPIASIGFKKQVFNSAFYLSGDLGAAYTGGGSVTGSERSGIVPLSYVDSELSEVNSSLDKLKIAPFFSLGVGFNF
jgi:hypothetical protein